MAGQCSGVIVQFPRSALSVEDSLGDELAIFEHGSVPAPHDMLHAHVPSDPGTAAGEVDPAPPAGDHAKEPRRHPALFRTFIPGHRRRSYV